MYTSLQPAQVAALTKRFNEIYPDIKLQFVTGSGLTARIDQERVAKAKGADAGNTTEADWYSAREAEGSLLPLTGPSAALWKGSPFLKGTYYEQAGSPWGIAWNTSKYDGSFTSYEDLLRPELKGKMGSYSLKATTIIAAYDFLRDTYGDAYMKSLAAQDIQLYPSNTPMAQALGAGEIAVAFFMNPTALAPLVKQGAPLKYILTKPVSVGSASFTAGFSWANHPNAARVLVDFMMGEGEKVLGSDPSQFIPITPATSGPLQGVTVKAYDPKVYTPSKVKASTEYWNGLFLK